MNDILELPQELDNQLPKPILINWKLWCFEFKSNQIKFIRHK